MQTFGDRSRRTVDAYGLTEKRRDQVRRPCLKRTSARVARSSLVGSSGGVSRLMILPRPAHRVHTRVFTSRGSLIPARTASGIDTGKTTSGPERNSLDERLAPIQHQRKVGLLTPTPLAARTA